MTAPKEQSILSANHQYQQAEQMINQAIARMDNETHIEYGSTMERKASPPKWKKWLHRLFRQN